MLPMRRDAAARDPMRMAATIPVLTGRCVTGSSVNFPEKNERDYGALMCDCNFPQQSSLPLFRPEVIPLHRKPNASPGWSGSERSWVRIPIRAHMKGN